MATAVLKNIKVITTHSHSPVSRHVVKCLTMIIATNLATEVKGQLMSSILLTSSVLKWLDEILDWCLKALQKVTYKWAPSNEFVSSSIPSWQILTAHAQPFRGARDLAFCLKVPLDSLLVWVSSEGSGETARMRRLAWTFAARIGDKYQIRLARPK